VVRVPLSATFRSALGDVGPLPVVRVPLSEFRVPLPVVRVPLSEFRVPLPVVRVPLSATSFRHPAGHCAELRIWQSGMTNDEKTPDLGLT